MLHAPAPSTAAARWRGALASWWPAAASLAALAVGGGLVALGPTTEAAGGAVWLLAITGAGVSMAREVVAGLRRREPGVDVIALLALAGAVLLGELAAGVLVAVMLTTGRSLEASAAARARRELTALLAAAPRTARLRLGDEVREVPVDDVAAGDVVLVRPGETIPVDGVLRSEHAVLDEAALTGEARPVERAAGERLASGAANAGGPVELRATATAARSTYAGLVRLVEQAQAERAPFVRMADRAAGVLVPVALAVAAGAWVLSGDPVRALAVLVVATPCPLILATPIAITSGMSRLARRGVLVKGGGALEALGRARVLLLDKTGTVTAGRPRLVEAVPAGAADPDDLLRLAAALDQVSAHVFAPAIVAAARARGLALPFPAAVAEVAGSGVSGLVEGAEVRVGRADFVHDGPLPPALRAVRRRARLEGTSAVFVAADGEPLGALLLDDPLRAEAGRTIRRLRHLGIERVVLLTGDHADVAELVGEAVDVDRVLAERRPEDKVAAVRAARDVIRDGGRGTVVMVGDGVNDAPALAHAHVGIAMGAAGATASSEAADVVVTVDRFDRVAEAIVVAQRTRRIAWQSVQLGMGLAAVAMVAAALGWLPPVAGALVQEGIDVAAILSALRALRGAGGAAPVPARLAAVTATLLTEHVELASGVERLRAVADRLAALGPAEARTAAEEAVRFLRDELLPHELAEEASAYPLLARGDDDPTGPLRHTHREIARLVRLLGAAVEQLTEREDIGEVQRLLYGLHAVLRLHMAQEEEVYAGLAV
jgi:heavy metal translocating P-type ATPase